MQYFVGWDVGGWNCENNDNSRDALVVLKETGEADHPLAVVGTVFRGNIRNLINSQSSLAGVVNQCCKTTIGADDAITIAIDTPLGLPEATVRLAKDGAHVPTVPDSYDANPYLYRQTELWLFKKGFTPLSAIKDMIGSQATKGMHLIAKLGLKSAITSCGVWTAGGITAIETYPTPAMTSAAAKAIYATVQLPPLNHDDKIHAVYCALVAYLFAKKKDVLIPPEGNPPLSEGWIWVPTDAARNP
jgi:predicted nuclease with RNAse H fold